MMFSQGSFRALQASNLQKPHVAVIRKSLVRKQMGTMRSED
jgi:hypothetical protein